MCFDYKTFAQEADYDDKATVLVCKDEITKMKFAHIEKIIEDIDRLRYTEVILKGAGEPALQEVLHEVKKAAESFNHSSRTSCVRSPGK